MRRILFIPLCFLTACLASNGLQYEAMSETNQYRLARVRKGMSEKQVLQIMHKPYSYETFQADEDIYDVWFYVTQATGLDQTRMVPQNLTPLTFKNGVLVGTGYNWYYFAMKEQMEETQAQSPEETEKPKPKVEDVGLEKALKSAEKKGNRIEPAQKPEEKLPPNVHIISQNDVSCASCSLPAVQNESFCEKCRKKDYGPSRFDPLMNGMTENRVYQAIGEPLKQETFEIGYDVYDVWFYDTVASKTGRLSTVPQAQTILTFKNAVLISKSDEEYYRLKKEADQELASRMAEEAQETLPMPKKRTSIFKPYVPHAPLGVVSPKHYAQVKKGMTDSEVQKMLGPTDKQDSFKIGDDTYTAWFYQIKLANRSKTNGVITFKNGTVIGTTFEEYKKLKSREGEEGIHSYTETDERMQEEESDQNFNYW